MQLTFQKKMKVVKPNKNGLGFYGSAAMLTTSQGIVYLNYNKQRIMRKGVGEDTQPGSWEHLSCKYKEGRILYLALLICCNDSSMITLRDKLLATYIVLGKDDVSAPDGWYYL